MKLTRHQRHTEHCPLCRDDLRGQAWLSCTGCGTRHHAGCFQELGGCATLGCSGKDVAHPRERRRPERWNWRTDDPTALGVMDGVSIFLALLIGLSALLLVSWAFVYQVAQSAS